MSAWQLGQQSLRLRRTTQGQASGQQVLETCVAGAWGTPSNPEATSRGDPIGWGTRRGNGKSSGLSAAPLPNAPPYHHVNSKNSDGLENFGIATRSAGVQAVFFLTITGCEAGWL